MLKANQLAGFGAGGSTPPPSLRFVGQFSVNFGGTTSATATVPAINLGPASSTKQILVVAHTESPTIAVTNGVTINGVTAARIASRNFFTEMHSAIYAGSGPFNVVVNLAAASSEIGAIEVYEADNCAPLYEGFCNHNPVSASGTAFSVEMRWPDNSYVVAGAIANTDTSSFTWSGIGEDADADAGDYRASSASFASLQTSRGQNTEAVTLSGASICNMLGLSVKPNDNALSGGLITRSQATFVGATTATFSSNLGAQDFNNRGNFKLVAIFAMAANTTITGVTQNGVAMTSLGSVVNTGPNPDLILHAFSIDNPGSGNMVVTAAGAITATVIRHLYGVYNAPSGGTVVVSQGSGLTGPLNVNLAEGGLSLLVHNRVSANTVSWTNALVSYGASTLFGGAAMYPYAAAEAARTITPTSAVSENWCTLAVTF